ncbi:MAG: hypothetical protein F4X64_04200 [Chloroflexi bacterium]|nr:hypothetical protein [Chloroflexota bacterium]
MVPDSRRGVDGDDSLLASVAGVPLTRLARVAVCAIWGGFWSARVLLTDALYYLQQLQVKLAISDLLGSDPVDQAFSVCMMWLTVEVIAIATNFVSGGIRMLIAKTPRGFKASIVAGAIDGLSLEELEAIIEKERKARQEKEAKTKVEKD